MKIAKSTNISFKGYDAVPIKNIYTECNYARAFLNELSTIGQIENFGVHTVYDNLKWIQDDKVIIERSQKPYILTSGYVSNAFFSEMAYKQKIIGTRSYAYITGGNSFIGKNEKGEKWILVGENDKNNKDDIAQEYGIKQENIHFLPQQNFHLDLFLRPIGYPYILVNNPNLVWEQAKKLENSQEKDLLIKKLENYYDIKNTGYCSYHKTIEELRKLGFKPIPIAGDWGTGINFINAIVNKHPDGSITYITNSTKCKNKFLSSIEKIFEEELKKKVPNLKNIFFVAGDAKDPETNYMMQSLNYGGGGLHCQTLEEPNFETWV